MEKLEFYDLKKKKKLTKSKYELKKKSTSRGMMYFAIAKTPSGRKLSLIVSKDFYMQNK